MGALFSFSKIFEVEVEIINFVNIDTTFTILIILLPLQKFWKKKIGLPLFFDQINNIINIYLFKIKTLNLTF